VLVGRPSAVATSVTPTEPPASAMTFRTASVRATVPVVSAACTSRALRAIHRFPLLIARPAAS
jgi:hypothetical protein